MKTPSAAFIAARDAETVIRTVRKVTSEAIATRSETNISAQVEENGISQITRRIEKDLNQFQPAVVSCKVVDEDIFIKSDGSGLYDPAELSKEHQIKVEVGLADTPFNPASQNALMFDGKLDPDSVNRINRETVQFTSHGWLKNAETFNAEGIADKDSFPFKNIRGILFVALTGEHPRVGAKTLSFSIEGDKKYLQYEGGKKVEVTVDGNYYCFSATREERITIFCDVSEMSVENQTDNFPIIDVSGTLTACYWWDNRTLEFNVNKIFDYMWGVGVGTRDINVREIETGLEKNFVYYPKLFMPNNNSAISAFITAVKLVDYDSVNNIVTFLIGVRSRINQNVFDDVNYCYKIVIDIDNDTYTATRIAVEINTEYQLSRFLHFANRWWVILGYPVVCSLTPNDPYRYYAYKIYRFNVALTTTDYLFTFPDNPPVPPEYSADNDWNIYLVHTAEVLASNTDDMYILEQYRHTGNYQVKLKKFHWNGAILVETDLGEMEFSDGITGYVFVDDYATITKLADTDKHYIYGIRKTSAVNDLAVMDYNIDDDVFATIKNHNGVYGGVVNMSRNLNAINNHYRAFYYYQSSADPHYRGYWIDKNGVAWNPVTGNVKTNYIFSSLFTRYDMWWQHTPGTNSWRIGRKDVESDYLEIIENKYLDSSYEGSQVAPMIYKEFDVNDCHYCGVVLDPVDRGIVPFVYVKEKLSTIKIADYTGMNCRQALTSLAEAFLCFVDIYEIDKARFYYRETNLGTGTLDFDKYKLQPEWEMWRNWADGIIIENSRENLRWRLGNTDYNARVIKIDNRFISEGVGGVVADWMYNFFNARRRMFTVRVPFYVEIELFDKITITFRDKDDGVFISVNTIVYETSFDPSPTKDTTHDMTLKLLEIGGVTIHESILIPVGNKFIGV